MEKRKGWKNYCSNQCRLNKTNKKNNFLNNLKAEISAFLMRKVKMVLVLNRYWQPIRLTGLYQAISKVYSGKALFVHKDFSVYNWDQWVNKWNKTIIKEEDKICSISLKIKKPQVILLTDYSGYKIKLPKPTRKNLMLRDRSCCQFCGKKYSSNMLTMDHVKPKSRGGLTVWENIVLACKKCNSTKDNRTPEEANMPLLSKPKIPKWIELAESAIDRNEWGILFKKNK